MNADIWLSQETSFMKSCGPQMSVSHQGECKKKKDYLLGSPWSSEFHSDLGVGDLH